MNKKILASIGMAVVISSVAVTVNAKGMNNEERYNNSLNMYENIYKDVNENDNVRNNEISNYDTMREYMYEMMEEQIDFDLESGKITEEESKIQKEYLKERIESMDFEDCPTNTRSRRNCGMDNF